MTQPALITAARKQFHQQLIDSGVLALTETPSGESIASNADRGQRASKVLSAHIARQLNVPLVQGKGAGQSTGANFEKAVQRFLAATFSYMQTVRPGDWMVQNLGNSRRQDHLARYEPYRHLAELAEAVKQHPELGAALGNSYVISPDVVVIRSAASDNVINSDLPIVDKEQALLSPFRASNGETPGFIHAVVSCKFTMRSDRSQNTRSEALNLIRNRKGRAPHIVAVTAEPTMSRIASLALGTGDVDMVYHVMLPELQQAVSEVGSDDAKELMRTLLEGNRLRDIADLPLDLAV